LSPEIVSESFFGYQYYPPKLQAKEDIAEAPSEGGYRRSCKRRRISPKLQAKEDIAEAASVGRSPLSISPVGAAL